MYTLMHYLLWWLMFLILMAAFCVLGWLVVIAVDKLKRNGNRDARMS